MTDKLYYKDAYIKEFKANIDECFEYKDNYAVILDKTAFFPCGGGQYGDIGEINGIKVIDTIEKDSKILHITENMINIGIADCNIDWKTRFRRMQNHSGEHILSGLIYSNFGFKNVGFHLGDDDVTLDCDGKLTAEDIDFLEKTANEIIDKNINITISYPTTEELISLEYRSKLDLFDNVRIVTIDGVDRCACCAPHVRSTAEIGLLKIIKHYNYKSGTRLHIKCGAMAREDYALINRQISQISNDSSVKREEVINTYEKQKAEIATLKNIIRVLRQNEILRLVENSEINNGLALFTVEDYSNTEMTFLLNKSLEKNKITSCVFSKTGDSEYSFIIGGDRTSEIFDILKGFSAKGGGREYIQGKVSGNISEISGAIKDR